MSRPRITWSICRNATNSNVEFRTLSCVLDEEGRESVNTSAADALQAIVEFGGN